MNSCHNYEASSMSQSSPCGVDGALDRRPRLAPKPKCTPAIFVHAGAGYHSHQNEHVHLQACVAAAEMGMKFLRAGSTATEAIEAALRILEDKEITNAGYGSNLSIDGTVECDATIVDHLGRSGACGAVPNIRNPISLAKLILDTSNLPLSLRRVPPNALVGEGARVFAEEHGIVTCPNEFMVSKNARDRFIRWQEDLRRAENRSVESKLNQDAGQSISDCTHSKYDIAPALETRRVSSRGHAAAIMAGTWNEGQPDSPYIGSPASERTNPMDSPPNTGCYHPVEPLTPTIKRTPVRTSEKALYSTVAKRSPKENYERTAISQNSLHGGDEKSHGSPAMTRKEILPIRDGSASPKTLQSEESASEFNGSSTPHNDSLNPRGVKRPASSGEAGHTDNLRTKKGPAHAETGNEDLITDTIGAIAIDENGQIAAGSSSGGIGMKHRGRLGPAALVGVGTAIVPCDEMDEDQVSVGAVTSGTGEHMATIMASQRCAERIYHGTRRGKGGRDIQDDDEDAILESFITNDFMNHPGVRNCPSAGAIGAMVVKKCRTGYYFYFAHNTDSFALASMGGSEKEPRCTMSRLSEGAKIAQGGRKVRLN